MVETDRTAITCRFEWGQSPKEKPRLIFEFHQEINWENIKELAMLMAQTAAKRMDCMNLCAMENEYGGPGGSA